MTSLSLQQVDYQEPANFWIGPRAADLIHLGAKFAPCMRRDIKILKEIDVWRERERDTACCIRNDDSGCVQSSKQDCSVSLSPHTTRQGLSLSARTDSHSRRNYPRRLADSLAGSREGKKIIRNTPVGSPLSPWPAIRELCHLVRAVGKKCPRVIRFVRCNETVRFYIRGNLVVHLSGPCHPRNTRLIKIGPFRCYERVNIPATFPESPFAIYLQSSD